MSQNPDYYRLEYASLLEQIPSAVFVIDPDRDRLFDVNSAACRLLGYERSALLERIRPQDIHPHEIDALMDFTRDVQQQGEKRTAKLSCMTSHGRVIPVHVNAVLTRGPDGQKLIRAVVTNAVREKALEQALEDELGVHYDSEHIVGESPAWLSVMSQIEMVAETDAAVLIRGETGTGKELVARAIHAASRRHKRPLIRLNCAAIPSTLAETELFGHEKGAFTGALALRRGRFEHAHEGSLFLDEIGDLPLELQPKLLRVLQEGEFERVGGTRMIEVDTRLIAATHRHLETMIMDEQFREDLYYRINVFPIYIPPLRERREDIPALARFAAERARRRSGYTESEITDRAIGRLLDYAWPGNARELENVMERAVILSRGGIIDESHVLIGPPTPGAQAEQPKPPGPTAMSETEKSHIQKALQECKWRVEGPSGAAALLEMKPSTLRSRMKKLGIERLTQ
jgi:PAS domain S-box-containing protein